MYFAKDKLKIIVRINFFLVLCFTYLFLFPAIAFSQSVQKLPNCFSNKCFGKPNDALISSDGSFILIVDTSDPQDSGTYIRKLESNSTGAVSSIQNIKLNTTSLPLLNLSQSGKKAVVFQEQTDTQAGILQVIDISSGTVKDLTHLISKTPLSGLPSFLDKDGKLIVTITQDLDNPELISINTESSLIEKRIPLSDLPNSLSVSPDFKYILVTYKETLGQSVSIFEGLISEPRTLNIDSELAFSVEEFSGKVNFDLLSTKTVLSSLGGNHALHLLDLVNSKLTTQILDRGLEGQTISTISTDGKTIISIGATKGSGLKIYKSSLTDKGISILKATSIDDVNNVLDVDITPDQNQVLILTLKNNSKQLKVYSLRDLSKVSETSVSTSSTQDSLQISPSGFYAISTNINEEQSVSLITLKSPSVLQDVLPPEIIVSAPKDLAIFNTRRIVVLGKVDGTGSEVSKVLVNGKPASLSFSSQTSSNIVNFVFDLQLESDGTFEIKISAQDKSLNASESTVRISVDTINPTIKSDVETTSPNEFKVTGVADGTSSNISSISVNSQLVQFTKAEIVNFSAITNSSPVSILVTDLAGNKNELVISPQASDKEAPQIQVKSPASGLIIKDDPNVQVSLTVTDNVSVKEVLLNNTQVLPQSGNQYLQNVPLRPGENLISISANDASNNKSTSTIKVTYLPQEIQITNQTPNKEDEIQEKETIILPGEIEDLNETLKDEFTKLSEISGEFVDFNSVSSIEISNPPPIPEGNQATIQAPETPGLEIIGETPEIPKGFSFATDVEFTEEEAIKVTQEEINKQNTALLVDSAGRTFLVGFGFLDRGSSALPSSRLNNKIYKFQTTEGDNLKLTTTITIPADANEGDATVTILGENNSLATIPLKISSSREVKVRKRIIGKPQINDPIFAKVRKSGSELVLVVKGKNFVGKIATIDGKLQRLLGKAKFFTNITFVPSEGITIKKFKLLKGKIILVAKLESVESGLKLFNVITPRGASIGGIVFPDVVVDGTLNTTTNPTELILTP